jgi:hypothetical protein
LFPSHDQRGRLSASRYVFARTEGIPSGPTESDAQEAFEWFIHCDREAQEWIHVRQEISLQVEEVTSLAKYLRVFQQKTEAKVFKQGPVEDL